MSFTIRKADNSDVEGVVDVIHTVFDEYSFTWEEGGYHKDLYDIEANYEQFFVAVIDHRVVGTVALELFDQIPGEIGTLGEHDGFVRVQGSDCSLERLYVHPDARRHGVGRALIDHVVHTARLEERKAMELWSDKRFGDAHRLYGRSGARVVGDRICHDPDQSPEWGLIIEL